MGGSSAVLDSSPAGGGVRRAAVRDLVALTKPRITVLNLAAAATGYGLAPGPFSPSTFAGMLAGTALVVGSANALNCWFERDSDGRMARTRTRPLPAGRLAPGLALAFGLGLSAIGVPLLALAVNPLTGLLAVLALLLYVAVYTPMKTRSALALLVGAVPGAAPPLIGWAAATGSVGPAGLLLFLLVFLWQVPHFLAITLFRARDYAEAGLKVLSNESGPRAAQVELVRYLLAQVAASFSFVLAGVSGALYLAVAAILGAALVGLGVRGLRTGTGARWARQFFLATNLYLLLLLAGLALDRFAG